MIHRYWNMKWTLTLSTTRSSLPVCHPATAQYMSDRQYEPLGPLSNTIALVPVSSEEEVQFRGATADSTTSQLRAHKCCRDTVGDTKSTIAMTEEHDTGTECTNAASRLSNNNLSPPSFRPPNPQCRPLHHQQVP